MSDICMKFKKNNLCQKLARKTWCNSLSFFRLLGVTLYLKGISHNTSVGDFCKISENVICLSYINPNKATSKIYTRPMVEIDLELEEILIQSVIVDNFTFLSKTFVARSFQFCTFNQTCLDFTRTVFHVSRYFVVKWSYKITSNNTIICNLFPFQVENRPVGLTKAI